MAVYRGVVIDLDGCVYLGERLVEGSDKAVERLLERGVKVLFLTNNSTQTSRDYCTKLGRLGVECREEMVLTSGEATAQYILEESGPSRVLPVTGRGFKEYCVEMGHVILPAERWPEADYVVVGLDREISYGKIRAAVRAIHRGARYVATNLDATLPTDEGPDPGAGAIAASITTASGVEPLVVGKPSKIIMEIALRRLGLGPREVLVIGDRLETDVMAGKNIGADTALVLSGATDRRGLERARPEERPDYVAENLYRLVERLFP